MRWLLRLKLRSKPVIVLNMDETTVLSPLDKRRGFFLRVQRDATTKKAFRRMGLRRTTLMGVICNHAALQKHLPQVLLPRNQMRKTPGRRMQNTYASMGAPMEAWHGTSGSVDAHVMKMWLRAIRKCIREKMGDVDIVLTMDCCSAHLSEEILKLAKSLGMHVGIIPAKSTWFLQTLDVKVFHHLKRILRTRLMAAEAEATQGVLHWQQYVDAIAASVHETLVQRDWVKEMTDMGIGSQDMPPSSSLGKLVAGEDLSPRPPSSSELQTLLGKQASQARMDWMTLLRLDEHVDGDPSRCPAEPAASISTDATLLSVAASGTGGAASSSSGATREFDVSAHTPHNIVRLSSRHRLTPAANATVKVEPPDRVGPSAGTRSQRSQPSDSQPPP